MKTTLICDFDAIRERVRFRPQGGSLWAEQQQLVRLWLPAVDPPPPGDAFPKGQESARKSCPPSNAPLINM